MTVYEIFKNGCSLAICDSIPSVIHFLVERHYVVEENLANTYQTLGIENLKDTAKEWETLSVKELNKIFLFYFTIDEREIYTIKK